MPDAPKVAILILNWNRKDDTLACLQSLYALDYPNVEMVFIDNASNDGSVEVVRQVFPQATVLTNDRNLGFAEGNNVGIGYAMANGADYIYLLNNDTEVAPDSLSILVDYGEQHPEVGIMGPKIYYYDHPTTIWSVGCAINWHRGYSYTLGTDEVDRGQYDTVAVVDFVTGCALLIKRKAVEAAGMLDPRFFMYYEETEWCVRVARQGFKVMVVPKAHIWHKIAPEQQNFSPRINYYMTRNRLLFLSCAKPGWRTWLYTWGDYGRLLLVWTIRPKWWNYFARRNAVATAITDYLRGRFGETNRYAPQKGRLIP